MLVGTLTLWGHQTFLFSSSPPDQDVISPSPRCGKTSFQQIDLIHKSKNAPVPYPTLHLEQEYVHFFSEWIIVGYAWNFDILHDRLEPGPREDDSY